MYNAMGKNLDLISKDFIKNSASPKIKPCNKE